MIGKNHDLIALRKGADISFPLLGGIIFFLPVTGNTGDKDNFRKLFL